VLLCPLIGSGEQAMAISPLAIFCAGRLQRHEIAER
jgi:hypothetical protein